MRRVLSIALVVVALAAALAACGGSSKKSPSASASSSSTTANVSQTTATANSSTTTSGGVTSAPGSGNPYGPNSPTEPAGLGRILVKDGLVKAGQAKCAASGLLKELSAPELQALQQNRASKELKAHVAKAAKACGGGAPSGG